MGLRFNYEKAKKMGYSDQEINQYLQSKQQQPAVQPVQPVQQEPEDQGFLSNLFSDAGSLIKGVASLPKVGLDVVTGKQKVEDVLQNVVEGTIDDYTKLVEDPLGEAYKRPLSTVLNVLPIAKVGSVASKAGKLGKAGEIINKVDDAARGTAGKVGNVISKPAKLADDVAGAIEKNLTNPKVKVDPQYASRVDALVDKRIKAGMSGSAEKMTQQMDEIYKKGAQELDAALAKSTVKLDRKGIETLYDENLLDTDFMPDQKGWMDRRAAALRKLDNVTNADGSVDIAKAEILRKEIDSGLHSAYKAREAGNAIPIGLQTKMAMADTLKKMIYESSDEVKYINERLSDLHKLSGGLVEKSKESFRLPVVNIPISTQPFQSFAAGTANAIRKGQQVGESVSSGVKQTAGKMNTVPVTVGGSFLDNLYQNPQSPDNGSGYPTPDDQGNINAGNGIQNTHNDANNTMSGTNSQAIGSNPFTAEKLAQAIAIDPKNRTTYQAIYEAYREQYKDTTPKPKSLSEGDKKFALAEQEASKALQVLEAGGVDSGKIAKFGSGFSEFFGTQDEATTAFKGQIATARTAARNALLGANMSDKEIESYLDAVFDYGQEPKILKARLRSFVNSMKDYREYIAGAPPITIQDGAAAAQ